MKYIPTLRHFKYSGYIDYLDRISTARSVDDRFSPLAYESISYIMIHNKQVRVKVFSLKAQWESLYNLLVPQKNICRIGLYRSTKPYENIYTIHTLNLKYLHTTTSMSFISNCLFICLTVTWGSVALPTSRRQKGLHL